MKRAQFAALIGVSKQQVSKYGDAVVVVGGEVDVAESLARLEGRLDEDKRQRAIAAAGQLTGAPRAPDAPSPIRPTAKQEREAVERDLKLLEYGRQAGELVAAADVDAAARAAVAEMREVFANGRRDLADEICATFGLAPEKSPTLQRFMSRGFERALGRFSERMTEMAACPALAAAPPRLEASL